MFIGVFYDYYVIVFEKEGKYFFICEVINIKCGVVFGILFGGKVRIIKLKRIFEFIKERICVVKYNKWFLFEDIISNVKVE